jgi:uncharacterized membrane protein
MTPLSRDGKSPSWHTSSRFFRHLATDLARARRAFPVGVLERIEAEVTDGEKRHRGQVCFVIEASLPLVRVLRRLSPRERALEVFGEARVWDTEENCGVLVYVLLADRDVEIVADRGIHGRVGTGAWESICRKMEKAFRNGRFGDGAIEGVTEINALLAAHYPRDGRAGPNELPDKPLVL